MKGRVLKKIEAQSIEYIKDIPDSIHLPPIPSRQREACKKGGLVLSPGLKDALSAISYPAVFIDFEAIQPAIPPWGGCRPFGIVPVQVSMHRVEPDGSISHNEWLSDDSRDPRPALSREVARAIRGAATLVAYHASFEQNVIGRLAAFAPPEDAIVLRDSRERFVDLLPIIRDFVYHPNFRGRFNLKTVVSVLLPELDYSNLMVQRGDLASWLLEEFIVHGEPREVGARADQRDALLRYCERDTLSLVELVRLLQNSAT